MNVKFTSHVAHEFEIVPFTRYAIKRSKLSQKPHTLSGDLGEVVCVCGTEEEARAIAKLLADAA